MSNFIPAHDTYQEIETWMEVCRRAGFRIRVDNPPTDLLDAYSVVGLLDDGTVAAVFLSYFRADEPDFGIIYK